MPNNILGGGKSLHFTSKNQMSKIQSDSGDEAEQINNSANDIKPSESINKKILVRDMLKKNQNLLKEES